MAVPVAVGDIVTLNIVGTPGPSLPMSIRGYRNRPRPEGKADPTWGTAFTSKFSKVPDTDAPLVTPIGAVKVVTDFLSRVEEIAWLAETQHMDMPTTMAEMKANGMVGFSLTGGMDDPNIGDNDVNGAAYGVILPDGSFGDAGYISQMQRRIEWEQYMSNCGKRHHTYFEPTKDGQVGIAYNGPEKNVENILDMKRALKRRWLASHEALPSVEAIEHNMENIAGVMVRDLFGPEQHEEHRLSRLFGTEDPDPERVEFHSEDLRGKSDVGYAGPRGMLGIDDEDDDESFEYDEE